MQNKYSLAVNPVSPEAEILGASGTQLKPQIKIEFHELQQRAVSADSAAEQFRAAHIVMAGQPPYVPPEEVLVYRQAESRNFSSLLFLDDARATSLAFAQALTHHMNNPNDGFHGISLTNQKWGFESGKSEKTGLTEFKVYRPEGDRLMHFATVTVEARREIGFVQHQEDVASAVQKALPKVIEQMSFVEDWNAGRPLLAVPGIGNVPRLMA